MTGILDDTNVAHLLLKLDKVSDEVLRDYFAASAMQATITLDLYSNEDELAKRSYQIAEAMIQRRRQTTKPKEDKS